MLEYIIIALLVVIIILIIILLAKGNSNLIERIGRVETNTVKELSDFRNDLSKNISDDFEKLEDKERLAEINKEFPKYRVVKAQEGFMQIFEQHLGVVESIESDTYMVRYWELLIPTKLSADLGVTPEVGSDVQFTWNHKEEGKSMITKVFKNLLE